MCFCSQQKLYDRLLRAYGLAYASTTAPRLLNLLLLLYRKKPARTNVLSSVSGIPSFAYYVVSRMFITRRVFAVRFWMAVPTTQKVLLIQSFCNQIYCVLAGSLAVRRFPTFCAALVGGYTFLQWPLSLLFDYASIPVVGKKIPSKRLSHAAPRFLAAVVSAWFSLEILNYKVIAKVDRKDSEQAAQDQQQHTADDLTLQTAKILYSKVSQTSPPVLAGRTVDLTLLAVTRALDSIVVNLYRLSHPSFNNTASVSSTLTAISRYADTFIFAFSSGTVVRLHLGADSA